ncbi:MAG: general secretion pathway protein GspK [Deltaproteobacteria bacterium]|nr:general secretion pathway protein GspK [Deltaproteobacteria bacterium]
MRFSAFFRVGRPRIRRARSRERGVALVVALLMMVLAVAAAAEFLYNTQVDLQGAANARQRQQARFAAKAGVEAGATFLRIDRFNDWAAMMMDLGMPGFGIGGFVRLANESVDDAEQRRRDREQAIAHGDKAPSMGTAASPYDPPNGYLSFISSTTGFNFFEDDNVDVEIRFHDEAGKFNINALVYWMPYGGGKPSFNVRLYRQIAQLIIDQTVPYGDQQGGTVARLRRKFQQKGAHRFQGDRDSRDEDALEDAPTVEEVGKIMCAILDWLDPDDHEGGGSAGSYNCDGGAERNYYTGLDEPYEPRNGPMESIGELRLIRGMTPGMYRKIAPFLTVYTRTDYNDPPQGNNNCLSTLYAPDTPPNKAPGMPCFSPDVNLHTAPDPVIEAFFIGGCQGNNPQFGDCIQDYPRLNTLENRENLLTAINCFRGPGLRSDRVINTQSAIGQAAIGEKSDAVQLGRGAKGELDGPDPNKFLCPKQASQGGPMPYLFIPETLKAVLNNANLPYTGDELLNISNRFILGLSMQKPPSPQKFDTITSRWITIEAVGQVGVATDFEPVESRVAATVYIPPMASPSEPPVAEILRWDQD